ncbi:hypothetical protein GCM10022226_00850 [Sphaerisporangium flaviroseum]|uniref:Replication initiation protein n=1 Tax=Sphaerisporangium flaviroseum TaxID=509199 RepID=A0ABP7HEA3_9ACTN
MTDFASQVDVVVVAVAWDGLEAALTLVGAGEGSLAGKTVIDCTNPVERTAETCPHGRPLSCTVRHGADEKVLGEPLCPDCYDYTGSVLFNAAASLLWARFADALRRRLANAGGLTLRELREHLVVSFAKVAEYQRRGVVHLHAVIRLDGRIQPLENLGALGLREHPRRLIAECFRLGTLSYLAKLRLTHWAHMLGYRGHFSTRSRRYSTTIGKLRALRVDHARQHEITTGRLPILPEDVPVKITHWRYAGRGLSAGDAALAAALAGMPSAVDEGVSAWRSSC